MSSRMSQQKMDWKNTVTTVSDKFFPGLACKIDNRFNYEKDVLANLPLQIALYFNTVLMPVWCVIIILFLTDNKDRFDELYRIIIVAIIVTIILMEMLRLYLGYEGNLKEKIPELAGFWMISILLQFPLQAFLLFNPHFKLRVLEIVPQSIMFVILCIELISGYFALKNTAAKQATYFRIMKLNGNVTVADIQERYKLQ